MLVGLPAAATDNRIDNTTIIIMWAEILNRNINAEQPPVDHTSLSRIPLGNKLAVYFRPAKPNFHQVSYSRLCCESSIVDGNLYLLAQFNRASEVSLLMKYLMAGSIS